MWELRGEKFKPPEKMYVRQLHPKQEDKVMPEIQQISHPIVEELI